MKRIILALIALTVTAFTVKSQDFRNTTWGMAPSEVKKVESAKLIEETSEFLVYETTIAHFESFLGYIFVSGKLTRAKYIINEYHSNENEYVSDYERLNDLLEKKYGEPIEFEVLWVGDPPYNQDDKSNWGHEIYMGRLTLYCLYKTSNTEIAIQLSAEDYKLSVQIEYTSLSDDLKGIEEEKILEDL